MTAGGRCRTPPVVSACRAGTSEVSGHPGDDPEHEHESDHGADDDSADAPPSMTAATTLRPTGDTLGEAPHPDHPDRGGAATGLHPATTAYTNRGKTASRGPTLAVFAPALAGRSHRPSLPRRSSRGG